MSTLRSLTALVFTMPLLQTVFAASYPLPQPDEALIGQESYVTSRHQDTLLDIGKRHGLGFEEMLNANPTVDTWLPGEGTPVLLPHRHILPATARQGIVVNVAEMRLYYYPARSDRVETYPVSVGRGDWNTPVTTTSITRKTENPSWRPPASIKKEHLEDGRGALPDVVPGGPGNPLGQHALYLSLPSYLIHGTNNPDGIGMQVTHGCIRMFPADIEHLYNSVPVGTKVTIVNQHYKVGWDAGVLYVEIHPWLDGTPANVKDDPLSLRQLIQRAIAARPDYPVDWVAVVDAQIEASGVPVAVGPVARDNTEDFTVDEYISEYQTTGDQSAYPNSGDSQKWHEVIIDYNENGQHDHATNPAYQDW